MEWIKTTLNKKQETGKYDEIDLKKKKNNGQKKMSENGIWQRQQAITVITGREEGYSVVVGIS